MIDPLQYLPQMAQGAATSPTMGPNQQVSPEALAELLGLGTLGEKNQLLARQLAQAQALAARRPAEGYGIGGGLAAGAENFLGQLLAKKQQDEARKALQANFEAQNQARTDYGQSLGQRGYLPFGFGGPGR